MRVRRGAIGHDTMAQPTFVIVVDDNAGIPKSVAGLLAILTGK
jgi:hypothetical protein